MEKLPEEILLQILQHLPHDDRLDSARICRRVAETVSKSPFLRNTRLNIAGFEMHEAATVLIESQRSYRSLKLANAVLSDYNIELWTKIGESLRELELYECSWSAEVFYGILRHCSRLETLKLANRDVRRWGSLVQDLKLPKGCRPEEIRSSLSNLRNLHLHFFVNREVLGCLLELMPNCTTLSLSQFYSGPDFPRWTNLPITSQMILKIDLTRIPLRVGMLTDLVKTYSATLHELKLGRGLKFMTDEYAAISDCRNLRHLTLEGAYELQDHHMKAILANVTELENLGIQRCRHLTGEGLAGIYKFKKLQRLTLRECIAISKGFLSRLGSISTLQHLDLRLMRIDSTILQSLACLKNLQSLLLDGVYINSECLGIICENFKNLKDLALGNITELHDADGVQLRNLKELRTLSFWNALNITDLAFVLGSLTVQSLRVFTCPALTDDGLASEAAHRGRLRTLWIGRCPQITDAGLVSLLERETLLEDLSVTNCTSLGDEWLKALGKLCPRLRTFNTYSCNTSVAAKYRFRKERPSVKVSNNPRSLYDVR